MHAANTWTVYPADGGLGSRGRAGLDSAFRANRSTYTCAMMTLLLKLLLAVAIGFVMVALL